MEESIRQISEDEYLVPGLSNLTDVLERLGAETKEEFDSTTVGGWVIEELGAIPAAGRSFEFGNLAVTVTKANARRVLEVKFKVLPKDDKEEEERD